MAEITALRCREKLSFDRVSSYRGGYRADERKQIEKKLKNGEIAGVVSTNALEAGIDVGGLDAVIISGFPGSMISVRQQAGRAGRNGRDAVITFVAQQSPLDQYYMKNPEAFFAAPHEHAIIDPENPYILKAHLLCACSELPFRLEKETEFFGETAGELIQELKAAQLIASTPRGFVYSGTESPACSVQLSGTSDIIWSVFAGKTVLETMNASQAYREGYPGAVIFHQGQRYRVEERDEKHCIIRVTKSYDICHTRPLYTTDIQVNAELKTLRHKNLIVHFGDATVSTRMLGYAVLEYDEVTATRELQLPPMEFSTKACWITLDHETEAGALHGTEHALIAALPVHVLCDRNDIGGVSAPFHPDTGGPAIFLYDGYEGGAGLAEKAAVLYPDILKLAHRMVAGCSCENGCPSCIHSPKCGNNNQPLSKTGTEQLLAELIRECE
jgi:DEAD/DEAH box helicase domain-containing protein